ncbi:hypothetical protein AYO44_06300 [Planctomycetaceae bacterium SCGC AG-212-F19]|nr:hypothetical protein AYO44_06300 [Planctomycetaceae bacterium SCGC AG-212-F19]
MNDHEAFLQGILQHPDDDAPRLVYADWLDEHTDPRGEFIRVQCELAKLPVDDPRWDELEQREWDLLRANEAEWTKDIKSIVTDWKFHRGFVDTVSIGARGFVDGAAKLFSRAPVRQVALTRLGTSRVSGKELAERPELARLHSLEVKGEFPAADCQPLLNSSHLQRLIALAFPDSDSSVLLILAKKGPPALEELNLSGMLRFTQHLRSLTAKLPFKLKKLNLSGTNLDAQHCTQLGSAPSLASLTHLDLSNNLGVRVPGAEALAKSPQLSNLVALALGRTKSAVNGCQIGLKGTQALAASPTLAHLESLDLRDNNLADSAVAAIVGSPHWTRLRDLWLDSNKVTTKGIETLVNWPGLARFTTLSFWVNYGIGDAGVKLLAQSPSVANLLHLDVGYTTLSAAGMLSVANSSHLKRLRHLNIEGNKIGDAGVKALVGSPVVALLRDLNLARTEMKDGAAKAIIASPHLRHLRTLKLNGNKLTNPTKKALEERFGPGVCQFGQQ